MFEDPRKPNHFQDRPLCPCCNEILKYDDQFYYHIDTVSKRIITISVLPLKKGQ